MTVASADTAPVMFRVLGGLEVSIGARLVALGQPKQQALLALLLLKHNRLVTFDDITHALWDDEPPRTARNQAHVYIGGLRRQFRAVGGPAHIIATKPSGYLLQANWSEVDLAAFDRLAARGRHQMATGDLAAASETLHAATQLWRGRAFCGIGGRFFDSQSNILEETYLAVIEDFTRLRLMTGCFGGLVGTLRWVCAQHPLHEGLRHGLMLALYGAGRPAEALAVYREGRQMSVRELGVEPGPRLRDLEVAILRGVDPVTIARAEEEYVPL